MSFGAGVLALARPRHVLQRRRVLAVTSVAHCPRSPPSPCHLRTSRRGQAMHTLSLAHPHTFQGPRRFCIRRLTVAAASTASGTGGMRRGSMPAAAAVPSAGPGFSVFRLPGMDPSGPAGYQASGAELLAAVAAAAPSQAAVWEAVAALMPRLLHATAVGPLRGFAVDLETSGLAWQSTRVIEIAVVDVMTGDTFTSLVNPAGCGRIYYLDPRAIECTGITPSMLQPAPSDPWVSLALLCWIYQRCRAAGGMRPVLIGHNVLAFDTYVLAKHLVFHGCLLPPSWCVVDTCSLARRWRNSKSGNALQDLRVHYGLAARAAHRALPDTELAIEVLAAMMRMERGYGASGVGTSPSVSMRGGSPLQEACALVQQGLLDGGLSEPALPSVPGLSGRGSKSRAAGKSTKTSAGSADVGQLLPEEKAAKVLAAAAQAACAPAGAAASGGGRGLDAVVVDMFRRAEAAAAALTPDHHGPDWASAALTGTAIRTQTQLPPYGRGSQPPQAAARVLPGAATAASATEAIASLRLVEGGAETRASTPGSITERAPPPPPPTPTSSLGANATARSSNTAAAAAAADADAGGAAAWARSNAGTAPSAHTPAAAAGLPAEHDAWIDMPLSLRKRALRAAAKRRAQ